jgi:hypothetical protein
MREIQLSKDKIAIVINRDFARISAHKWYALFRDGSWHAARTLKTGGIKRTVYMHHEVARVPSAVMIDHRNRNGLDNRRGNLRKCTKADNARNSHRRIRNKTSAFKGVSLYRARVAAIGRPWRATITVDGKQIYLGWHATEVEAATSYDEAARRYFGKFACTNF